MLKHRNAKKALLDIIEELEKSQKIIIEGLEPVESEEDNRPKPSCPMKFNKAELKNIKWFTK